MDTALQVKLGSCLPSVDNEWLRYACPRCKGDVWFPRRASAYIGMGLSGDAK